MDINYNYVLLLVFYSDSLGSFHSVTDLIFTVVYKKSVAI